ncbi:hypothetical protein Patl1_30225 [Pistacia atlantica]|uniref:Uncharacterized protein n=1 Tax=Pistacia atlantica TaxID=434234 RepID=A0ACC1AD06_9ROSI|nr:hypothetical protein Patl1_30225 [Pistacia atlantica]
MGGMAVGGGGGGGDFGVSGGREERGCGCGVVVAVAKRMGKNEKTGLGRALVKHHNQMIQQSKEKGNYYRNQNKKVLESVTDISDIDAIIQHNEEAQAYPVPIEPINLDAGSSSGRSEMMTAEERKEEEALHASSLRVPRRPPWNAGMSVEELDDNERQAFLVWRRSLARLEENEKLVLTPFEKNLDIWRQLWRVLERSDLGVATLPPSRYMFRLDILQLVMVVDGETHCFTAALILRLLSYNLSSNLRSPMAYAREIDAFKRTLLLVNKADLLPFSVREKWAKYFRDHEILFVFWSAKAASAALEGKTLSGPWRTQDTHQKVDDPDTKIYGREELLAHLQSEAEEIVKMRRKSGCSSTATSNAQSLSGNSALKSVVGFVGYPNVGKSSTINALVGQKRTGVTSTPGKTKHFQTLIISDELTLCDCPGLVFPSFSSSRYDMIASGVLPIDRMTEHRKAVQVVANRVPRHVIENVYKINLPKPKPYEPQSRPPLAIELLRTYCASRGYVASSGLPDETRAARQILKDFLHGKLPHYQMPPGMSCEENDIEDTQGPSLSEIQESDESDIEDSPGNDGDIESAPVLEHVLDHLNSFDLANGLASEKAAVKKPASHKHHKKPQKKKDRSWRIGNDDDDGMPVLRVFQKPANTGPVKGG